MFAGWAHRGKVVNTIVFAAVRAVRMAPLLPAESGGVADTPQYILKRSQEI